MKKQLPECPVEVTLTMISDKWKVLILRDLLNGTKKIWRTEKVHRKYITKSSYI